MQAGGSPVTVLSRLTLTSGGAQCSGRGLARHSARNLTLPDSVLISGCGGSSLESDSQKRGIIYGGLGLHGEFRGCAWEGVVFVFDC